MTKTSCVLMLIQQYGGRPPKYANKAFMATPDHVSMLLGVSLFVQKTGLVRLHSLAVPADCAGALPL